MLKITPDNSQGSMRLTLEGRLAGAWVKELEQIWCGAGQSGIVVDLTGVTFIAEDGKALLSRMWREGAELIVTGCCNSPIVEHITGSRLRHPSTQRKRRT